MSAPAYFSSLAPFADLFATGLPILTYHKLGPRPRHARIKGLYLSRARFTKHLAELHAAGFRSQSLDVWPPSADDPRPKVAITFDDGFANVLTHALDPLAANKFQAIQFLVADRLGQSNEWDRPSGEIPERLMDAAEVKAWLAAGHQIGSHTRTHPHLTRVPLAAAREEITASKKALEDLFGLPVAHFCYPYGDWNPAVRDLVIEAGYRTACTTDPGVNTPATSPFELKRFAARYPSRNLKAIWAGLRGWKA